MAKISQGYTDLNANLNNKWFRICGGNVQGQKNIYTYEAARGNLVVAWQMFLLFMIFAVIVDVYII